MRLAVVDPSFHWPPTGGSWVDLREVLVRLRARGLEVSLFTVRCDDAFIPRGTITADPGFPAEILPVSRKKSDWPSVLKNAVTSFQPDTVLITNTFSFGPDLIEMFAEYPVFIRIYGFEIVCPNYMSVRRNTRISEWNQPTREPVCPLSYLTHPTACTWCALRSFGRLFHPFRSRREPMNPLAGEYFQLGAFWPWYHEKAVSSLNRVQGILVYNDFIAEKFSRIDVPIHRIPGGVDTVHFSPGAAKSTPRLIVMPGRVQDPRKGFPVFQSAVHELQERYPELLGDLEIKVTDPSLESTDPVIQSTGWIPFPEMPELYRSAYFCVIPTNWPEPFGLTALEAMACGAPVIASDIGGFQQTVLDQETGLRVPPGDPHALADAMIMLLQNPELRDTLSRNAVSRAGEMFEWDRVVARYYVPLFGGQSEKMEPPAQLPCIMD